MTDIRASVGVINGRQCHNFVEDQQVIMRLLNQIPGSQGGTLMAGGVKKQWGPAVPGRAAQELHAAILDFQRANQGRGLFVDGHIDPGQKGIRVMNELAEAPKEKPLESRQFAIALIGDMDRSGRAVAVIGCSNEVSTTAVTYRFSPKFFVDALTRKLQRPGTPGSFESMHFETPEAMSPYQFAGQVQITGLFNSGRAAVSRLFFTATRSDGSQFGVAVNFGSNPADPDYTTINGFMALEDQPATATTPPVLQRLVMRPQRQF